MLKLSTFRLLLLPCFLLVSVCLPTAAQTSSATLSGVVEDSQGAVVPNVKITVTNPATGLERSVTTGSDGSFVVPLLPPATYTLEAAATGFKRLQVPDLILNVSDQRSMRIRLEVGDVAGVVEVRPDETLVDNNPAVATAIDRNFVNSLPLNGRSLQTLILLAPGVVNTPTGGASGNVGQFSVNGQRTNSNYFTIDGVSGNFASPRGTVGQQASGSLPATNSQGGFSNLASVDAIQEFSIQTSTFAPEFGRSPGGQISIVTRGGENRFRGSLFEYFRNDALDANDFFNNANGIKRQALRYNNYGGTIGGPVILPHFGEGGPMVWKGTDKTFFFFSYEGQRFLLPQPTLSVTVPSLSARQNAPTAVSRAILDYFPLPNGATVNDGFGNPVGAIYTTAFSNLNNSDSYSVRIDHNLTKNISLFGRVNHAPSSANTRNSANPSIFSSSFSNTQTLTLGSTQLFGSKVVNEIRANASRNLAGSENIHDGFGGGVDFDPYLLLPTGIEAAGSYILFDPLISTPVGKFTNTANQNRQFQIVDNISFSLGSHQLKFGGDYRLLLPLNNRGSNSINVINFSASELYAGSAFLVTSDSRASFTPQIETYGFYGQDTWKASKRLTLTFGLRWEINPSPTGRGDKKPFTLLSPPDLTKLDQSGLQLAPDGTPYYETDFTNIAPRFGLSYLVSDKADQEMVIRGGIGVFYDLGQSGFGNVGFPYSKSNTLFGLPIPLPASAFTYTPLNFVPSPTNRASLTVAGPDYTAPRTYQWNLTAERSLGKDSAVSVAYVAAQGRDLARALSLSFSATPQVGTYFSPNYSNVTYIDNGSESDYHSMQVQYTKRLSKGFQALANYTWAHSIDNASTDTSFDAPGFIYDQDIHRGDSNFDLRHNFTAALTYQIPVPKIGKFGEALLRNWSLNGIFIAHSGLPYTVLLTETNAFGFINSVRRPNLTGQPLYIEDPTVASGRRLNQAAFDFTVPPPTMGSLGRNALRGENFWQVDLGLHREFRLGEKVNLQLRGEAFNLFNHPNFLYPNVVNAVRNANGTVTTSPLFGRITSSAARAYSAGGGYSPLFQSGGPRSLQFAARLSF
ncbi:MAG: TonB-dependent receptor [Acidobacteria bacterium]|nr:TonB-dependent receptor [Acidobacteriota bacterium]